MTAFSLTSILTFEIKHLDSSDIHMLVWDTMRHRTSFLDFFKAIATQGIVLHHLSSYGFIAQFSILALPSFRDGIYNYGRLLVQVFFVISGFLVANKLHKNTLVTEEIFKRYLRLVLPYLGAIFLIVCTSYLIKFNLSLTDLCYKWDWLSNIRSPLQVFSHIFLAHDLLSQENLSTGVWYVAIDFQLFIITMLLVLVYKAFNRSIMLKVLYLLIGISLFCIPKSWDYVGIYFFYSYGIGILLYTLKYKKNISYEMIFITTMFALALFIDFRIRILISYIVALLIFIIIKYKFNSILFYNKLTIFLSKNSYSVFLTHFIIVMLMNFIVSTYISYFIGHTDAIVWILVAAWACSILLGQFFYIYVEKPITRRINKITLKP